MRAGLRGRLALFAWTLAFAALELLAFWNAGQGRRLYAAPVGLRYETPRTGPQVLAALEYAEGPKNELAAAPVFWGQGKTRLQGPAGAAAAQALWYWGEAALVWPGEYTAGTAPGPFDEAGCAVSEALAWRLWGSLEPVGLPLMLEGAERRVRGVFRGQDLMLLAPAAPAGGGFTAAELAAPRLSAAQARGFAQNCGLGTPDLLVYGEGMTGLMELAAWLPAAAAALALAVRLAGRSRSWRPLCRECFWFFVLAGAALGLPALLACLPEWLLPSRWSDFGFWGGLARQLAAQVREWFALPPTLREAAGKGLLLCQGLTAAGLALCTQRLLWAARRGPQQEQGSEGAA